MDVRMLACAAVLGTASCADRASEPHGSEAALEGPSAEDALPLPLLLRAPDAVFEERERLEPGPLGFGAAAPYGFEAGTREIEARGEHVWANEAEAALVLPALGPAPRTVLLEGWAHRDEGEDASPLAVELNGRPVGSVELPTGPGGSAELATPADAWRAGPNELVLRSADAEGGTRRRFALTRVVYGAECPVLGADGSGEELVLSPGTSVVYHVAAGLGPALVLEGRAEASGRVELSVEWLEVGRGEPGAAEPEPPESLAREVAPGPLSIRWPLPAGAGAGDVLGLRLRWLTDGDGPLRVARLDLPGAGVPRPPIVFVSIDTLAARNMSLYGHERETTPELERFAQSAVTFDRCKANAPWTAPSYASQMTGLLPRSLLALPEDSDGAGDLPPHYRVGRARWTLAELLRSAGYGTAAFVDNPFLLAPGFRQGFDVYDVAAAHVGLLDPEGGMHHCFPEAAGWIAQRPIGSPFLAFVQVLDCHGPYLPTEPFDGHFEGDELARATSLDVPVAEFNAGVFGAAMSSSAATVAEPGEDPPRVVDAAEMMRAYDEKVREVDAALGDFLRTLRERPDYDELIVVVSADHGESMAEKGQYFNHSTVYEPVLHVPLLVRLPHDRRGGTRVAETVELVDLYPTLAELAGLPHLARHAHGRSLVPLLEGDADPEDGRAATASAERLGQRSVELDGWKLVVFEPDETEYRASLSHPRIVEEFGERLAQAFDVETWPPPEWYRRNGARDLLAARPAVAREVLETIAEVVPWYELYHLDADPDERTDLAAREPERVAELLARLREREAEAEAAARPESGARGPEVDLEELERLGYVDRR